MSGNAALAAAKRRRNPVEAPTQSVPKNVSFSSNNEIQSGVKVYRDSTPTTPVRTILEHDRQIFFLERKVEELSTLRKRAFHERPPARLFSRQAAGVEGRDSEEIEDHPADPSGRERQSSRSG